jgi:hypothetical protein
MEMPPSNRNCEVLVRCTHIGAIDGLREQRCASTSSQQETFSRGDGFACCLQCRLRALSYDCL